MGLIIVLVVAWVVLSPMVALLLAGAMRDRQPPPPSVGPIAPLRPVIARRPPALSDEVVAVTAHGLASSCSLVVGAGETLRTGWADMSPEQRDEVLGMMVEQTKLVQQVLVDLTHGVAGHVTEALDTLERPFSLPASDVDGAAARP